jgi:glutamate--cysteine ligase
MRPRIRRPIPARRCRELFAPRAGAFEQIGLELELIPVDAVTRRRCPIVDRYLEAGSMSCATLPVLRQVAAVDGWSEQPTPYGAPLFVTRDGAVISYEPGGQIEYSAAPARTVSALVKQTESTVAAVTAAALRAGIDLLTVGIDPYNSIGAVPLQLRGARYALMDQYFAAIGSAGACMMRQTAACQITVDAGPNPVARWRLLNGMAPYVTALFANSPCYAQVATGCVSTRAHVWRHVDPARTGCPGATSNDPASAYEAFALEAPGILWRARGGEYRSFESLLASGDAAEADWAAHLTTLFPEVRPRRKGDVPTFELRSADAIPIEWIPALCVLVVGLLYDRTAREEAMALLGSPHASVLARSAQLGLGDAAIQRTAAELYVVALEGAARLGDRVIEGRDRERAAEFGRRYVFSGRALGTEVSLGVRGDLRPPIARHGELQATARR